MDVERKSRHVVDSLLQSQHFKGEKKEKKKNTHFRMGALS
jgi:hypothetical protein